MTEPQQPTPTPDSLSRRFARAAGAGAKFTLKAAGIYLWPFAARWEKPFSRLGAKKKLQRFVRGGAAFGAVLVAHQVVHSGTGMLFPTAEDFLAARGLDPALAQQLSDHKIRVRSRDFWGTTHALNDIPTIFGLAMTGVAMATPGQAYAVPGHGSVLDMALRASPLAHWAHCPVMLQAEDVTVRDTVAALGNIQPRHIEQTRISDEDSRMAVAFHEFRHCHTANHEGHDMAEADSDVNGVLLYAQVRDNPEIARHFLYARALSRTAHGHDTALALDAAINGTAAPESAAATARPTADAFALADIYMRQFMAADLRPTPVKTAHALQRVMTEHGALFSDAAKRRAELYIEAVQYFMPHAFSSNIVNMRVSPH